jgi:hypothetical protein
MGASVFNRRGGVVRLDPHPADRISHDGHGRLLPKASRVPAHSCTSESSQRDDRVVRSRCRLPSCARPVPSSPRHRGGALRARIGNRLGHAREGNRDSSGLRGGSLGSSEVSTCLAGIRGSRRIEPAISAAGSPRDGKRPAVGCAQAGNKTCRFTGTFTGATGLEPATSGVTGRSWRLRAERGSAGITGESRSFRLWGCGDSRVRTGASGDLLRDMCGMLRCPAANSGDVCGISQGHSHDPSGSADLAIGA